MQNINNKGKLITIHKNIFVDIPKQIDSSNMVKTNKKYQDYLVNPVVNTFATLYKHP